MSSRKKKPAHKTEKIIETEKQATTKATQLVSVNDTWEWTEERERCLDFVIAGNSNVAIAKELGVHRKTVENWKKHPTFLARLEEMVLDQRHTVRLRRIRQTNALTERTEALVEKAFKVAEEKPESMIAQERAMNWASEFRAFREQERIESGENVQRHEVSGVIGHAHLVGSVRNGSFKEFLTQAIDSKVIDVESIEVEGDDAEAVVKGVLQAALRDGNILDIITEEDRQQALAEGDVTK